MLRELVGFFRSAEPLKAMGDNFAQMFDLAYRLTCESGELYFAPTMTPEQESSVYLRDVEINKLERAIRKQIVAHLSIRGNTPNLPYCLQLMSLVKDVERIGDYAKNLIEVHEFQAGQLPDDTVVLELKDIRRRIEEAFKSSLEAFAQADHQGADTLIRQGRVIAQQCDALIVRIAESDYAAAQAVTVVLGVRYYKRIIAHVLNVLSSLVMPLHKLDYFDEDDRTRSADP